MGATSRWSELGVRSPENVWKFLSEVHPCPATSVMCTALLPSAGLVPYAKNHLRVLGPAPQTVMAKLSVCKN